MCGYDSGGGNYQCGGGSCGYGGSSCSYNSLESIAGQYNGPAGDYLSHSISDVDVSGIFENSLQGPAYEHPNSLNYLKGYEKSSYSKSSSSNKLYFKPDFFLNENRPFTRFIGDAEEIKDYIKESFKLVTGGKLPEDIVINICDENELKKFHQMYSHKWDNGIQGFALNRKGSGISSIFIKKDNLDKVMLTVGHEIGHVLTKQLPNKHDEEAKAFAFSLAWMKAIKENNIANLAASINLEKPARNGLHNIALDFVLKLTNAGRRAIDVYVELMKGNISITGDIYGLY